jgi:anaerobic selenocysteine-containing dehydrogenase
VSTKVLKPPKSLTARSVTSPIEFRLNRYKIFMVENFIGRSVARMPGKKKTEGNGKYQSRDSIKNIWGKRTPYQGEWKERVDEHFEHEPDAWVQSACVLCSTGCGLDIGVKDGKIVGVRGRAVDRVNRGRLGPKGLNGWMANNSPDRLTQPLIKRGENFESASWDEALDLIVEKTKEIKEKYTGHAIGFYNSGQLFLEEYYTLALMGDVGVGTPHMDGNTRLCTATSSMALMESFGTDGAPGSYTDFDTTDVILMMGHNMANTQTVLWSRILDRLKGTHPPTLIVVDPRKTDTAKQADLHIQPRLGTNVALLNGLLKLIIDAGNIDEVFIRDHTVGFEILKEVVSPYTPAHVSQITGVSARKLVQAAEILGNAPTLISTVLQGVYQSNQATAAAVQINNLHLIRGMIGKPGCTVFQMNGQPTAQNTRECGANGELVAFRNWANIRHVEELAKIWNVNVDDIPHVTPPTHAMEIFRYAETGSIRMLWIIATNPAVSMPELKRIREICDNENLFLVVQDAFMTETAEMADVVLPAAIWGEKTGCFTNADRTVHISHKAVEPPGEARPDLDIFMDFANRMGFKDKDGKPLIKWKDSQGAFEAFKKVTHGRPCDYSGLTYEKLSEGSGIQWPCNDEYPNGRERLYEDGVFNTNSEYCEIYGHDLMTGAALEPMEHKAKNPNGRAVIKAAEYVPPSEIPDDTYPFFLTTGRVVYHWHTRTKTGRVPSLNEAAPNVYVEISRKDADALGVTDGDTVEISTRRGKVEAPVRISNILRGHLFLPFHYGYWDDPEHPRAANELTITGYDEVSKQPHFKFSAARIQKVGR